MWAFFRAQPSAFRWVTAVGALVVVLGGAWLMVQTNALRTRIEQLQVEQQSWRQRARELEQQLAQQRARRDELTQQLERERTERERLEQELATQQPSRFSLVSFILFPTSRLRSEGQKPPPLVIPAGARSVELRLEFEPEEEYKGYRVEMRRRAEENLVWSDSSPRIQSKNGSKMAVLKVPANVFGSGDYRLTLQGVTTTGELEKVSTYEFALVIRQ